MQLADTENTRLEAFGQSWPLQRYPVQKGSQLRAWDTADLYLLDQLETAIKEGVLSTSPRIAIVHDHFGALSIPLNQFSPLSYGDSWMSREAIQNNLSSQLPGASCDFYSSLDQLCEQSPPELVIGRVPKSKAQLSYLLCKLRTWVDAGTELWLAGMDKHLSRGQFDLLARYFGPTSFLPGWKKARIWKACVDPSISSSVSGWSELELPDQRIVLRARPNVFCHDQLDQGSRFFLQSFGQLPEANQVADMACGSGVLGLAYLKQYPQAEMLFCDESYQAIESVQWNVQQNTPDCAPKCRADDGLKQAEDSSLDLILCNPPFHQQTTVSKEVAWGLFRDALKALKKEGELWLVANRHLGYHVSLKRLFGNCETVTGNKKFVILRSVKS